jgi:hypothetical protein
MRAGGSLLAGVLLVTATACASSSHNATGPGSPPAPTSVLPGSSTTSSSVVAAGHLPTAPNCGGGAYRPRTLLIVCGVGTAMATGVQWATWTSTSARGTGTVNLDVGGRSVSSPARLLLEDVVGSVDGPQYSVLTVTWTGTSPDGHPTDTYHLTVGAP